MPFPRPQNAAIAAETPGTAHSTWPFRITWKSTLFRSRSPERRSRKPVPSAESAFRRFLECGIHRFGTVRYRCPDCGEDLFVPFSCKRRGLCPSCDSKRAELTVAHSSDNLLPDVPYRQWVLVVPKVLRWHLNQRPDLVNEVTRILADTLEKHLKTQVPGSMPGQEHFIQRFGSDLNLHIHIHAVVSDGLFEESRNILGLPVLSFHQAPVPTDEDIAGLTEKLRRRIIKRFVSLHALTQEKADMMLSWDWSGFSLHAKTSIQAQDRKGLENLLRYCARPGLRTKRLTYSKGKNEVQYRTETVQGRNKLLKMTPLEFMRKVAVLIPPPNKNLVHYYGALAPNSPLRELTVKEARKAAERVRGNAKAPNQAVERLKEEVSVRARSWAALLSRIFEIEPLICSQCGGTLVPVAAILDDRELERITKHLGLPSDLPKTVPAKSRPPPLEGDSCDEDSQVDPRADLYAGIDSLPAD
ncbi:MAG: transposase [Elusimicrobia bacterium]|nr:transposase [Elusimicrobiota bacterium]